VTPTARGDAFRSMLFAPGDRARVLGKALAAGADAVIFDLEDAVAPSEKDLARRIVAETLATAPPCPVFVRINALDTPWGCPDVQALAGAALTGIVLPKSQARGDVDALSHLLDGLEARAARQPGEVEIVPLIETAAGVLGSAAIAGASRRVRRVAFGAYDFANDLGVAPSSTGDELFLARAMIVLAAAAAGVQPIDSVFANVADATALAADASRARRLGFTGKLAIHPSQLGVIHRLFAPTPEELDDARRTVAAADRAEADGRGAFLLDGKLVDRPIAERARRLVDRASRHETGAATASGEDS
jgi:citrate lyase subunit beta/citryl-CoA lyase